MSANNTAKWNNTSNIHDDLDSVHNRVNQFATRLKEDPEFRAQFERKQRKLGCIKCLVRIFCCPCIAIWNLSKI